LRRARAFSKPNIAYAFRRVSGLSNALLAKTYKHQTEEVYEHFKRGFQFGAAMLARNDFGAAAEGKANLHKTSVKA
jgi:hypothetical protein